MSILRTTNCSAIKDPLGSVCLGIIGKNICGSASAEPHVLHIVHKLYVSPRWCEGFPDK